MGTALLLLYQLGTRRHAQRCKDVLVLRPRESKNQMASRLISRVELSKLNQGKPYFKAGIKPAAHSDSATLSGPCSLEEPPKGNF